MTNNRLNQVATPERSAKPPQAGRDAFAQMAEPYRRQIKAYCYRMMGSLHEAEDLTQETFLKAWRAFDSFEGRGSLKAWLYQIATRVCLDAIRHRKHVRRMLPEAEFSPATTMPSGQPTMGAVWLEPYPDSELDEVADDAPGPDARYEKNEAVRYRDGLFPRRHPNDHTYSPDHARVPPHSFGGRIRVESAAHPATSAEQGSPGDKLS
jgi:RNA polymerase sigma factor (sigma-70 family)